MKKKLVSVLLSAAMVATLLAGCGGGSDESTDSADGAASGEKQDVALRLWGAEEDRRGRPGTSAEPDRFLCGRVFGCCEYHGRARRRE